MSIIIRLQNLPLEANSLDIRRFFQGLHIPDGGVHIVGGENGDAFIAFGGDEDARQAMERNGNPIKNSRIKLLLSSRNEMQRVIDNARTQTLGMVNAGPSGGGKPPVGPGPQGPPPSNQVYQQQGHPGQYPQPGPPPAQNIAPPKPAINSAPGPYGQMYPGSQGPPTQPNASYAMPLQQQPPPAMKGPPPNDQFQRIPPFRNRSRSRSPPAPRIHRDLPNEQITPQVPPVSSMQSGLMGSLQQVPPPAPSQPPHYAQNGSYGNGTNGAPPQAQGSFDNGNYYQRQQFPQSGPPVDGPKFGGQDDRWTGQGPPQGNVGQPGMVAPGQMTQQDNYQNPMYRNQSMPPAAQSQQPGPYQQQPLPSQQQQQQQPPFSQYPNGQMYPNEPTGMTQGGQGPTSLQPQSTRMFTLQMWNLPLNARPIELVNFFAPLYLLEENIKILNDDRNFPTGMALVRFPTAREFDTALNYNGKFLMDRQIQIRPLDEMNGPGNAAPNTAPQQQQHQQQQQPHIQPPHSEPFMDPNYPPGYRTSPGPTPDLPYTNNRGPAMGGGQPFPGPPPQGPNKELAVYMKGLPFTNCTPRDVEQFFQPIHLANIEIERDPRGKPSGNAFVEFENRQDYERGMEYNMRHMGRRYIELIPLSKLEKQGPRGHHGGPPPMFGSGGDRNVPPQVPTHCISVKCLSPNVTSQDLKMYFGNNGARPYAVHIMLTPGRMNAGEAFLEFIDKEIQKRALKLDGEVLHNDRITVRPVPYEVVMGAINRPMPGPGPMGAGAGLQEFYREGKGRPREKLRGGGPPPPPPFQDRAAILLAIECPSKTKDEDFCVFFEKFKITPDRIKQRINENGTIDAQISFLNKSDADYALRTMDNKYFLGRSIRLEYF